MPFIHSTVVATLTSSASSPTAQSPIPFTITFSRSVIDFTQSSLSVVRGFISGLFAVSESVYSFFVTPTDNDVVTVSIDANEVHDIDGAGNTAAQHSVEYDSLQPHLALAPDPLPTSVSGAFTVTLNSTVAVDDFSSGDVSVTNAIISNVQTIAPMDGRNYSFTVTPVAPGAVTLIIPADMVHSSAEHGNVPSNSLSTTYNP